VGGGLLACGISDNISAKSGLGAGAWSGAWSGVGLSAYGICDNPVKSGLGDGAWSGPGMSVDPSSNELPRFCDAAVTALLTFASRRTSGLPRTAAGAASAKLMMESIRRNQVSVLCCRIFVGYVT
jgi:hypothetical protein